MRDPDFDPAVVFFRSAVVCCAIAILILLAGCESLGLTRDEDKGLPGFWRSLEKQQNYSE